LKFSAANLISASITPHPRIKYVAGSDLSQKRGKPKYSPDVKRGLRSAREKEGFLIISATSHFLMWEVVFYLIGRSTANSREGVC